MEDIKTKALQAHSEGRLLEAERSYRILLEQSDDPDVAVNLELLRSQKDLRGQFTLSPLPAALAASAQPDSQCLQLLERHGRDRLGTALVTTCIKQNPDDREFAEALAGRLHWQAKRRRPSTGMSPLSKAIQVVFKAG